MKLLWRDDGVGRRRVATTASDSEGSYSTATKASAAYSQVTVNGEVKSLNTQTERGAPSGTSGGTGSAKCGMSSPSKLGQLRWDGSARCRVHLGSSGGSGTSPARCGVGSALPLGQVR